MGPSGPLFWGFATAFWRQKLFGTFVISTEMLHSLLLDIRWAGKEHSLEKPQKPKIFCFRYTNTGKLSVAVLLNMAGNSNYCNELPAVNSAAAEISLYSVNSVFSLNTTERGTNTLDSSFWRLAFRNTYYFLIIKYSRLSLEVVTCDVDRGVSTANC